MRVTFEVSTGNLVAYSMDYGPICIKASSGRGPCMNNRACQAIPNEGPIPIGYYSADPRHLSDPGFLMNLKLSISGDWGDWNIPLLPSPSTHTFGRGGFYLHCGMERGTAGCIDVGGGFFGNEATETLKKAILLTDRVELEVLK